MIGKRPAGVFITGTGTGVGKTFVAEALARTLVELGIRVGVYKPVLSGCREDRPTEPSEQGGNDGRRLDDDVRLWLAAGRSGELSHVSPQRFRAPLAPHLAARIEGRTVDESLLRAGIERWREYSDFVIVEGAGGLFSPISDQLLNADLACDFGLPLLVVTANQLGVVHATIATLLAVRSYAPQLTVAAIVLNDVPASGADSSRELNFSELVTRCAPSPVIRHGLDELRLTSADAILTPEH